MTTSDIAAADALLPLLERERALLLDAVARVPADRQGVRPSPEAWSAAEVVEHVARVERGVVRMLAAARAGQLATDPSVSPIGAPLPAAVVAALRDRTRRLEAPERVRPAGRGDMTAALEELAQARAALLDAYRTATTAMLDGASYAHPYLGPMTLRAWVEMAAHHGARHAAQVEAMREGAVRR